MEQIGAIRNIFSALLRNHGVFCLPDRGKKMDQKNIPPCPKQTGDIGRIRKHDGIFHHCST